VGRHAAPRCYRLAG